MNLETLAIALFLALSVAAAAVLFNNMASPQEIEYMLK